MEDVKDSNLTDMLGMLILGGVFTLILAVIDIRLACLLIILSLVYYIYAKFIVKKRQPTP